MAKQFMNGEDKVNFKDIQKRIMNGIIPAVPVPFNKDGSINNESQCSYVKWMDTQPITAVALWAHTGRGCFLSREQRADVFNTWRSNLGEDKLILCGAGAANDGLLSDEAYIAKALEMATHAKELGADLLMPYPPTLFRGHKNQDEMIVSYHKKMAELELPMVLFFLYEEAGGITYSKEVLKELFKIPNVIGIKMATLDSVMTYQEISNLITEEAPEMSLITGEDRMFGYTLMRGARGALVGLGSVYTQLQVDMMEAYYKEDYRTFMDKSLAVDRLAEHTFYHPLEGYIERVLYILARKGIIDSQTANDPFGPGINDSERARIDSFIEQLGDM